MRSALLRAAPTRTPFAESEFNEMLSIRSGCRVIYTEHTIGEMSNGITSKMVAASR